MVRLQCIGQTSSHQLTLAIKSQFLEAHPKFPNATIFNREELCGVLAGNIYPRSQRVLEARNFWTVEKLDMKLKTEVGNVTAAICFNAFGRRT